MWVPGFGVSPTAFARYLTQHAQGIERSEPFLSYVSNRKEIAVERAAEISQLRHGRRILLLHEKLDPASLEAARVRAGVIVKIISGTTPQGRFVSARQITPLARNASIRSSE